MKHHKFQPNGRCGNCQIYRRSKKEKHPSGQIVILESAACAKNLDPKTCGDEFKPRGKKSKRMKNRNKKWERRFNQ